MSVTGIEFSNVDKTYAWKPVERSEGFSKLTLFAGTDIEIQPANEIVRKTVEVLNQVKPDVVAVPGWSDRASLAALQWCVNRGVPAVVMSETTAWDFERSWWKEWIKARVLGCFSSGLVGGKAHVDYLEQLGINKESIFKGYDAVDNDYFEKGATAVKEEASKIRKQMGLPECFFLASARFVEKKNLAGLLIAYSGYRKLCTQYSPWDLVLVGDGPLRAKIEAQVVSLGLTPNVHLPGFKQYDELPAYYGLARAFVHASTVEQWGLVVNEAMASGLPVLVSDRCGCAGDLVKTGENGFTFDPYNTDQLANQMYLLMQRASVSSQNSTPTLDEMGKCSQAIIQSFSTQVFAQGLLSACQSALQSKPRKTNLLSKLVLRLLLAR